MAAENNTVRTNHLKAKRDKIQSECKFCCDGDETVNYIKIECSKLAQKEYKIRYDWVGKVIHRELRKKLKFNRTAKWDSYISQRFLDTNRSLNPDQKTRLRNS